MSEFSFSLVNDDYQVGEGGRIQLASPIKTVKDRILTRLQTELGEWYLDNRVGVPWYTTTTQRGILGSKMQSDEISAILRRQILDVDGVVRIETFNINFDNSSRSLSVNADVTVIEQGTAKLITINI